MSKNTRTTYQVKAVVAGAVFAEALPANRNRDFVIIQNDSPTETLYVDFNGLDGIDTSWKIYPSGHWEPIVAVPTNAIRIAASAEGVKCTVTSNFLD